ncbi:hypothetical protein HY404_02010 [Candidatus Microgenomates bacterium]|nr:hypothetical protein [Candidatus Microgenomates bacterium]
MIKQLISPVQAWLISQGRCVGCGRDLNPHKPQKSKVKGWEKVTCSCGRVFLFDSKAKKYRRALLSEI